MRFEKKLGQREDSWWDGISQGVAEIGFDFLGEFLPDSLVGLLIVAAVFLFALLIWAIHSFLQD
jgi:hypothetical protein